MKTVRASGTWTTRSPLVWAGPTSINSMARPPTVTSKRSAKTLVGGVATMPPKSNGPKAARM